LLTLITACNVKMHKKIYDTKFTLRFSYRTSFGLHFSGGGHGWVSFCPYFRRMEGFEVTRGTNKDCLKWGTFWMKLNGIVKKHPVS
jgi:hypothetical protein